MSRVRRVRPAAFVALFLLAASYALDAQVTSDRLLNAAREPHNWVGGREGHVMAIDARTGTLLWKSSLGGQIVMGPVTYSVDGKQHLSVIAGNGLFTFALRD